MSGLMTPAGRGPSSWVAVGCCVVVGVKSISPSSPAARVVRGSPRRGLATRSKLPGAASVVRGVMKLEMTLVLDTRWARMIPPDPPSTAMLRTWLLARFPL